MRYTAEGLAKLADEVWNDHEPDDSGLCRRCRLTSPCAAREMAGQARAVYGPNVPAIGAPDRSGRMAAALDAYQRAGGGPTTNSAGPAAS